jgi:pyruvate formate lyase activating enzyme
MVISGKYDSPARSMIRKRFVLHITRMTVHNGPGIRTLVLFKGCPLRCVWCSTPESQAGNPEVAVFPDKCIHCDRCLELCPTNSIRLSDTTLRIDRDTCNACGKCTSICYSEALRLLGQDMTVDELLQEIKKDEVAYKQSGGGVTLSGGEPLMEMEFTLELIRSLDKSGISVGIDTSGFVSSEDLEMTFPYVSFFLWDLKVMDEQRHKQFCGVSNRLILDNLVLVAKRNIPIYIRIPLIPGYNDSRENIAATCEFVKFLKSLVEVDLLPLHHLGMSRYASLGRPYPVENIPLIPDSRLQEIKDQVESYGLNCSIVA